MIHLNDHILEIISTEMGIKKSHLSLEQDFIQDLNADSIDTINILTTISAELNVQIPMDHATQLTTISKLIKYVEEKLQMIH